MLGGCVDIAERILNMPVRIGSARDIVGLKDVASTPQYTTGIGLLKYGIMMEQFRHEKDKGKKRGLSSIGSRIMKWIEQYL